MLYYLYGPGRKDEHTDPHMVAAWDPLLAPDPGREPSATLTELANVLDAPVLALSDKRRPAKPVWHCSVRTAPEDRHLSEAEWATIARRIVAAVGIAPDGDLKACRWVAIRHADDHIHIVATVIRVDGKRANRDNERRRAQAECRRLEVEFGLRRLNPGDGTAHRQPTGPEQHKARRTGRAQPARETLRERVRLAVASAADEAGFFAALGALGVLVERRRAPSGDALGYRVALPGDVDKSGVPVWFPGGKLAPDLSLPKIRARLAERAGTTPPPRQPATVAWRYAIGELDPVPAALGQADASGAGVLVEVGAVLDAAAAAARPVDVRVHLRRAQRAFENATRSRIRADHRAGVALSEAARGIVYSAGGDLPDLVLAAFVHTLIGAVSVAVLWHEAHQHAQQAEAARLALAHLRAAQQEASTEPLAALRSARPAARGLARYAQQVRSALPDQADRILADEDWPALAAQLQHAERNGSDGGALLQRAEAHRELDSATHPARVIIWRIVRLAGPAPAEARAAAAETRTGLAPASPGFRAADEWDARHSVPSDAARPAR
ncbi:relaxase/mobilization nuclease domain-containing protein [Mangrovactinospora gilvigrisea]|uniref:relaxase/mobilization nuclease domain-containing protein n=1 Tax=Mangrovactinospora gilvigrisea TaxID=1428644 RepID=UPI001114C76C|nr:mobilization protein [Mangrovactinospora gilvigrisea]